MCSPLHLKDSCLPRAALLFPLLIAFTLLVSLPPPVSPVTPGLDPSWQWAFNALALSDSGIGHSAFFTLGPLGFLLVPMPFPLNAAAALVCNLFCVGLWTVLLAYLAAAMKGSKEGVAYVLMTFAIPVLTEWRWTMLIVALLLTVGFLPESRKRAALAFSATAGFLTVFCSLLKFNLAITSGLTVLFVAAYLACFSRRRLAPAFLAFAAAAVPSFFLARHVCFHSFAEMLNWCKLSWEISTGYNAFMPTPLDFALREILFILFFLGTYAYLALYRDSWKVPRAALFIPLIPLFFLVYKHNITRAGCGTSRALACIVPFATAFLVIFCDPVWRRLLRRLFLGQWLIGLLIFNLSALRSPADFQIGLSVRNLLQSVFLPQTVASAAKQSEENLSPLVLPPAWRETVSGGTFQSLPLELTYAPANNFTYAPFLFLQGYKAYTRHLDALAAEQYYSSHAPGHILFRWESIDRRHPLLDCPATWDAILSNYHVSQQDETKILLSRNSDLAKRAFRAESTCSLAQGEWFDLPAGAADPLYLSVDWPQTALGKAVALLFRNTQCSITLEYASGERHCFRAMPESLRSPFPARRVPFDLASFKRELTSGYEAGPLVKRFRFDCDSPCFYRKTVVLTRCRLVQAPAPAGTPPPPDNTAN